jgi:hypothetical protein
MFFGTAEMRIYQVRYHILDYMHIVISFIKYTYTKEIDNTSTSCYSKNNVLYQFSKMMYDLEGHVLRVNCN